MPPSISSPLDHFWSLDSKNALQMLSCSDSGLSASTAEDRLKSFGPNTLKGASHSSGVLLSLSQFKSPITLLLIAAALLSMALGDLTDAVIILIIILISRFWVSGRRRSGVVYRVGGVGFTDRGGVSRVGGSGETVVL